MKGFIQQLSAIDWPAGSMLLLDDQDYQAVRKELLEPEELNFIEIKGIERSTLEVFSIETYDRGAYKRANEYVNQRLRPRNLSLVPYDCVGGVPRGGTETDQSQWPSSGCGHKVLMVTSRPKGQVLCDECGGRMERTTT